MNKIVLKTALKTLLALIIALLIAFGVASLGFPASMATAFEKLENYSFATSYASLAYAYSGKVEDLARCAEDSIFAGNDGDIIKFCEQLIYDGNGEFVTLCKDKDENSGVDQLSYRQYIYGNYAAALYIQGEKDKAFNAAESALDGIVGFPKNNALARLAIEASTAKDAETANKIIDKLSVIAPTADEQKYYDSVLNTLSKLQ